MKVSHRDQNYRSRRHYESKVLHNTEEIWYLTAHHSLRTNCFDKKYWKYHSSIHHVYFDTFWVEIGQLYYQNSLFKFPWKIEFWAILLQNWLKSQFLGNSNSDCELYSQSILALKVPKEALWMALRLSIKSFTEIIGVKETVEPWKSRYFSVMK